MGRQNLSQGGAYPWAAHGCLEGAAGFATDFRQLMGPEYRDADQLGVPFGTNLPSERLQFETACAALQSKAVTLEPGGETSWTFFGFFEPDHPAASSDADLSQVEIIERASKDWAQREVALSVPPRSLLHDARSAVAETLDEKAIRARYRRRTHVERGRRPASVFLCPGKNAQPPRRPARQGAASWRAATVPWCAAARRCCRTRRFFARPHGCTACSARSSPSATRHSTSSFPSRAIPTTSPAPAGCAC